MNPKFITFSIGKLLEILALILLIPAGIAFFEIETRVFPDVLLDPRLLGFSVAADPLSTRPTAVLKLYWKRQGDAPADNPVRVTVTAGSARHSTVLSPGSRIWPAQSWAPGLLVEDTHRIRVGRDPLGGDEKIRIVAEPVPRRNR